MNFTPLAESKLTAQGQISVPAEVRKKLGVGPGSILEWDESNDQIVVRKAGRHTSVNEGARKSVGGCGYLEHWAILAELHLSGDTA